MIAESSTSPSAPATSTSAVLASSALSPATAVLAATGLVASATPAATVTTAMFALLLLAVLGPGAIGTAFTGLSVVLGSSSLARRAGVTAAS